MLHYRLPHPRLVYLDLNHWIGLAKAARGHAGGEAYRELLGLARTIVQAGSASFPLSGTHYMELSAIRDPRQRADIAEVMAELSGYRTLICRSLLMRLEVESALDAILGSRGRYMPLEVIDVGFGHAFGKVGKLRISNPTLGNDDDVRARWPGGPPAYDSLLASLQTEAEWRILRGPLDDDLESLDGSGYDALSAQRVAHRRAEQEVEQVARLDEDPRWRRGRIRDVIAARYIIVELMDMLQEALAARSATLADLIDDEDREAVRSFVDAMPSGDVHVSLQVEAHRNPQSTWTVNDFFDIDALSLAVPYCDVVATDRRRAHDLRNSGCGDRLVTKVTATPHEVVAALS
jgi:hypothetical protein